MMDRLKTFWLQLIHWSGWTAWLKWPGWTAWLKWPIWNILFLIHPVLLAILMILSAAGLVCVFLTHRDTHWTAIPIYVLSAYTLSAACISIPPVLRRIRRFLRSNPHAQLYFSNEQLRFTISLYFEQIINTLYGLFKTLSGIFLGSAWIGADGLYNLAQGVIQLIQILRRKKQLTMIQQWKSYRVCGWMMLILHLTITGLVFQMTHMGRHEEYPGYLIFVTALFAFYKLISSFIDVAKDRKNKRPVDSSVRLLNFSQALFSLFSLQAAMIPQFGGSVEFAALMNTLTGSVICAMVAAMGVYMLRRSRREIKKLEESVNG